MDDTEDQPYPQLTLRFFASFYPSDIFIPDRITAARLHDVILSYRQPTILEEFKEIWE